MGWEGRGIAPFSGHPRATTRHACVHTHSLLFTYPLLHRLFRSSFSWQANLMAGSDIVQEKKCMSGHVMRSCRERRRGTGRELAAVLLLYNVAPHLLPTVDWHTRTFFSGATAQESVCATAWASAGRCCRSARSVTRSVGWTVEWLVDDVLKVLTDPFFRPDTRYLY